MLDKIFSSHLPDLQSALSRTTQRQALLTDNIANINTPGYKRQDIDFHVALQNQIGGRTQAQIDLDDSRAQALSDQTSLRPDGNNVDMEREVTSMAQMDLRYQALTEMTSDYFTQMKSVIREGK
jgi:flagellar basal-body rod protein FlgB